MNRQAAALLIVVSAVLLGAGPSSCQGVADFVTPAEIDVVYGIPPDFDFFDVEFAEVQTRDGKASFMFDQQHTKYQITTLLGGQYTLSIQFGTPDEAAGYLEELHMVRDQIGALLSDATNLAEETKLVQQLVALDGQLGQIGAASQPSCNGSVAPGGHVSATLRWNQPSGNGLGFFDPVCESSPPV